MGAAVDGVLRGICESGGKTLFWLGEARQMPSERYIFVQGSNSFVCRLGDSFFGKGILLAKCSAAPHALG